MTIEACERSSFFFLLHSLGYLIGLPWPIATLYRLREAYCLVLPTKALRLYPTFEYGLCSVLDKDVYDLHLARIWRCPHSTKQH